MLINGKTPEEIKVGIDCSATRCSQCPYYEHVMDSSCSEAVINDAITLIEHLEAQIPKWISVGERLPEQWKTADGTLINYLVYIPKYGVDIGNYIQPDKTWVCMGFLAKVTHWMLIPKPQEGEDDDRR